MGSNFRGTDLSRKGRHGSGSVRQLVTWQPQSGSRERWMLVAHRMVLSTFGWGFPPQLTKSRNSLSHVQRSDHASLTIHQGRLQALLSDRAPTSCRKALSSPKNSCLSLCYDTVLFPNGLPKFKTSFFFSICLLEGFICSGEDKNTSSLV